MKPLVLETISAIVVYTNSAAFLLEILLLSTLHRHKDLLFFLISSRQILLIVADFMGRFLVCQCRWMLSWECLHPVAVASSLLLLLLQLERQQWTFSVVFAMLLGQLSME